MNEARRRLRGAGAWIAGSLATSVTVLRHMARDCRTDADCAAALVDWCVAGAQCDVPSGACITWPRCRAYPHLGCLAVHETCVALGAETHSAAATPVPASPTGADAGGSSSSFSGIGVMVLVLILLTWLFGVVAYGITLYRRYLRERAALVRAAAAVARDGDDDGLGTVTYFTPGQQPNVGMIAAVFGHFV